MVKTFVYKAVGLIVVGLLATACTGDDEPAPPGTDRSSAVTSAAPPPGNPPGPGAKPLPPGVTDTPPPAPPKRSGTAVITTRTLSGAAVPHVPVQVRQMQPCNPAQRDIPPGANEIGRWDGKTDANGRSVFQLPLGCFYFSMDPPPGTFPVPEGLHALFLTEPGQQVTGQLRFNDPAATACTPQAIARDLDDLGWLADKKATVSECDGRWAVIVWDVPGDSQRIVRRPEDGKWRTYVVFPHDTCRAKATADGVPARLQPYFLPC